MKKFIFLLCYLFIMPSYAKNETVTIYTNHTEYQTYIVYELCPLNKNPFNSICDPIQQTKIIDGVKKIKLPNFAFFIRIYNAIEYNPEGIKVAMGHFPGSEDCKGFNLGFTLLKDNEKGKIECIRIG